MTDFCAVKMQLSDFDFALPDKLIAQSPAQKRGSSRLLVMDGKGGLSDRQFADLTGFLKPGDLLVFNDTKVIKARLYAKKESGGKAEIFIERVVDENTALALVRASHGPKPGTFLFLDDLKIEVIEKNGDFYWLRFDSPVLDVLEHHGKLPLPPYITHAADELDEERYQTVYARHPGAVAAPTAGLHFDEKMLEEIRKAGAVISQVTLHVGAGTFQPVRCENVREHKMHSEVYHVPEETATLIEKTRKAGGRVICVGTTSLRALESFFASGKKDGETAIFITPGFEFRAADLLLTNFHLPRSTLLMLVCAFAGTDNIKQAYLHAVEKGYRFFSYGDAMLLERKQ